MDASVGKAFVIGDRVVVGGGYDMEPVWLMGGDGYAGTFADVFGKMATVELDHELVIPSRRAPWENFGSGNASAIGELRIASGRWLALSHGYEGRDWVKPILRVHVGLCRQEPELSAVPPGGGIGAWVESHAMMWHLENAPREA